MSSTSGSVADKTQLFVRKGVTVSQWNFKSKYDDTTVDMLKSALAAKVTVGDAAPEKYKHLVLRVTSESERRKNAITIDHIDVEEGVKFDENMRTIWPEKYKDMMLRAFLYDTEYCDSAKQFISSVSDEATARKIKKRCGYTVEDIIYEPMEAPVTGKHKVTYIHDAAYYAPLANILSNHSVGDKIYMAGWSVGVGEYFGEMVVSESDHVDIYGRKCLKWEIKGEDMPKYHPQWDVKPGIYCDEVVPALVQWDELGDTVVSENIIAGVIEPGKKIYYTVDRYMPGSAVLSGKDQMFGTFVAKVISQEDYEKTKSRPGGFDLGAAMAKAAEALRAKQGSLRSVSPFGSEASTEDAVPNKPEPIKRAAWNVEQIAAQLDVDYKDPRVTMSRANQLVLQEYPGITIGDKSDMVEKIMRLICAEMSKRKMLRDGLTEAVLGEWQSYSDPSSSPAQGMLTRARAWFHGSAKSAFNKVADGGSAVGGYAQSKVAESKAKAAAGSVVGAVMPLIAIMVMSIGMIAFLVMVGLIMAKMYRTTARAAAWSAVIMSAMGSLAALGDAPAPDFIQKMKDAAGTVGAVTGTVMGKAMRKAV